MVSEIVPVFDAFFKVYTVYSVKEADRGVVFLYIYANFTICRIQVFFVNYQNFQIKFSLILI